MGLAERISQNNTTSSETGPRHSFGLAPSHKPKSSPQNDGFQQLKLAVHNRLFESIDVSRLEALDPDLASSKVSAAVSEILNKEGRLLTESDRWRLIQEIRNELLGTGPLEPLLWDDEVSDILVNGWTCPGLMDTPKSARVRAQGVHGGEGRETEAAEVFG